MIAFAAFVATLIGIAAGVILVILGTLMLGPFFWVPYVLIWALLRVSGLTPAKLKKSFREPEPFQMDESVFDVDPSQHIDVSKMPKLGSTPPPPPSS